MREGGENDAKGMVSDVEGVWSLGGRETLSSMRDGIFVCVAVVMVVVALVISMLVVAVGVVALVIVVRALRELCIGVVEVDCTGVVDIMVLGGVFVGEVVERVELVIGCVVRQLLCEHVVRANFCLIQTWLFGGCHGCESSDRG